MYISLILFGGDFIYPNHKDDSHGRLLDLRANKLILGAIGVLLVISSAGLIFVTFPLCSFFFHGEMSMIVPLILPYTNPESNDGYLINLFHQVILAYFGLTANFGIEIISCLLIGNLRAGVDTVNDSVNKLNESLKEKEKLTLEHSYRLRNILVQIQDLDRYLRT